MNSKVEISVGELRATFLGKRGLGVVGRGSGVGGRGAGVVGRGSWVVGRGERGDEAWVWKRLHGGAEWGAVKPSTNASRQWDEVVCCSRHGLRWDR